MAGRGRNLSQPGGVHVMTKICSHCKTEKSIDEFTKNITTPDGLTYNCRSCNKILSAAAYARRPKKVYDKKAPAVKKIKKRRCLGYLANGEDCKAMQRGFFCIRHRPDNLDGPGDQYMPGRRAF